MEFEIFEATALLLTLAALFGLFNHHVIKLPFAIGMMISSLVASLGVLGIDAVLPGLEIGPTFQAFISDIDFTKTLLEGMIGFLLFAGSLHTDLDALRDKKGAIVSLASLGLALSTCIMAAAGYYGFRLVGLDVPLLPCLLFGALISPTDPIAVLGIMRAAGAPEDIEIKVVGESLFNDGFAVVLFSVLLSLVTAGGGHGHGEAMGTVGALTLFLQEVVGGIGLGVIGGYIAYRALRTLEAPDLEILISIALVMGVSALAFRLHFSAPLGCVVAGLLIGNRGRMLAMSEQTRHDLDVVWNFIEEALNALLFLLIGLEVVAIPFNASNIYAALLLIPVAILARFAAVAGPMTLLALWNDIREGSRRILTWGGLKGGISIALAMSIPHDVAGRDAILTATYAIVIFSIAVQGLTVGTLIEYIVDSDEVKGSVDPNSAE